MKRKVRTVLVIKAPWDVKISVMDWGLGDYIRRWKKYPENPGLYLQFIASYPDYNQNHYRFRFWDSTELINSSPDYSVQFQIKSIFVS